VAGHFDFSGGTLSVGGTLSNFSLLASSCRLEAADLAGDLTVHGTFAPGQSPADTMLDGAFVLASDGTLEMELAGYLPGTEYDRLTVTGESMLDGTLSIVLLNDFAPVYGATFDLFNWDGDVSGTFGVTNFPALGEGLGWDTSALYQDGIVAVVRRLPQDWRELYNLPENDPAGSADSDSDGMTNYSEWKAGTDPTDPDSFFQTQLLSVSGADVILRWNSLTNRTYRVEMSTNLLEANAFAVIQSGIQGNVGNTDYTVPRDPGEPAAFYRTVIE
jgi:hypothetical protein